MKKRIYSIIVLLAITIICSLGISGCSKPHLHEFGEWQMVTEATCTEKGKEKHTCTVCSHFEERDIEALGHNFSSEFTIDIPATCTAEGSKSKHCLRDGCTEKTEITAIPMVDHTYGNWEEVTTATCTEKGKEKHTCTVCSHFEERDIEALGHNFSSEFTIDIPPTCTAEGSKSKHCLRDGCTEKTEITAIPALDHNYQWTVTTAPTETVDGIETEVCQNDSSHTRETRTLHAVGTAGLQFTANAEYAEYTVSGYSGTAKIVYIPAIYNNKPVTIIGANAFENNTNITEVHMKEGIRQICDYAFYFCMNITKFTVPDSVQTIENYAFYACNITSFTIGSNVTKIGWQAFRYCEFTTIIIPISVIEMENSPFGEIDNLTIFAEAESNPPKWYSNWNNDSHPVYWAGEWHVKDGVPAPHSYGEWHEVTAATCTEKGKEERTCLGCNHIEQRDTDALGHIYGIWEEVTSATCTGKGKEKRTCTVCNHFEERDIDALGHHFASEFTIDIPATCTAEGSKSKHCLRDGCTEKTEITAIPALDHNYQWTVTTAPTETVDGIETEVCQNDSSHTRETRTLHAVGTAGLQFTANAEDAEYTVSGYSGTAKIVHIPEFYNGKPVTIIGTSAFEMNMNITEVHMKEGIKQICDNAFYFCMSLINFTVPKSVQVIGECAFYACPITSFTVGENVVKIGDYAFRYCQFTTIIMPLSVVEIGIMPFQDIENLTIFTEHTTKTDSWDYYWNFTGKSAEDCHPVYWANEWHTVDGVPAPHSYGEWHEVTAATCTEKGKEERTCLGCNHIEQRDIEVLEHAYGEWQMVTEATCTEKGKERHTCTVCNYFEERDIDALGHNFADEFTIDIPATCTAEGSKSKHCSRCAEKTEVTAIPKLEHTYGEWQEVTAATCTEKGKEKRTCTVCGHFEERDIDALGHDYQWTFTTAPTETADGEETEICQHNNSHTRGIRTAYAVGTLGLVYGYIDSEQDKLTVIRLEGDASVVHIPAFYDGLPVTSIDEYAFKDCTDITSITIGGNIKSIGNNAFNGCKNLTAITIPESVTSIGFAAFNGCSGLVSITLPFVGASRTVQSTSASFGYIFGTFEYIESTVASQYPIDCGDMVNYYLPTSLINVTITDIDGLHSQSFYGCTKLETIIIPDGIIAIGDHTFRNCTGLVDIIIPNSVIQIGTAAFYNCTSLTSITIPDSVTLIRNYAFNGCGNLTSIIIGNNLHTIEGDLVFVGSGLQTVYCELALEPASWAGGWNATGATVHWLSDGTMREYNFVTNDGSAVEPISAYNIQIAPTTEREGYIFYRWFDNPEFSGNSISFPYFSKTNLTLYASWDIECVYIFYDEDGVTELKREAVAYASEIVAPANPTKASTVQYTYTFTGWDKEIPQRIFENLVFTAQYSQAVRQYTLSFDSNGGSAIAAIMQDYGTAVSQPADPEKPAYIFDGWYTNNGTFVTPYEFTTITESITLYAKWTEHPGTEGLVYALINGEYYISGYNGTATEVVVPLMYNGKKVVSVANGAFVDKTITSVTMGSNISSIGNSTFSGCSSLSKIIIPDSVTEIGSEAFSSCSSLTSIIVPNSVTRIGDNAFYGCIGLTRVTLSNSLTNINRGLFYGCSNLSEIIIGSGTMRIDDMAFGGCSGLSKVYYNGTAQHFDEINLIQNGNANFSAATKYFYSEIEPIEEGNYWHYDTDGKTPIIWIMQL